jgi:iron complex outermembrane receptor protein
MVEKRVLKRCTTAADVGEAVFESDAMGIASVVSFNLSVVSFNLPVPLACTAFSEKENWVAQPGGKFIQIKSSTARTVYHAHMCRSSFKAWVASLLAMAAPPLVAQDTRLGEIVVSASRGEQSRFDAPAAVDAVRLDPATLARPLVNLSELVATVPGLLARDRQNYAQDLQLSVRGFGTRSTFGVRGVRILIDGIPATMPDGQGQAASASLMSASRIEVLRGPLAQLYGNAAGGVVQVFTRDPVGEPNFLGSLGAGSYGQRQAGAVISGGSRELSGLLDLSHFQTDGYREHSAAERNQANARVVARPSDATTISLSYNAFQTPLAQDPLGLTRAQWQANPRQATPEAFAFDTRKSIEQKQGGAVLEHRVSKEDSLQARLYYGTRQVFQTLAMTGALPTSSGGVVDLDRSYGGVGLSWTRKTQVHGLPLNWTAGIDADRLRERRRGYVNNSGTPGALRRDEDDTASNLDAYGQLDWTVLPQWRLIAGARASRVRFAVSDDFVNASSADDSGSVRFNHASPVLGTVWHVTDVLNLYANLGQGFETPTLAEAAYRAGGSGPNFGLRAASSRQAEAGLKYLRGAQSLEAALFMARTDGEIVPSQVLGGRTIYQNVDAVRRRGLEAAWKTQRGPWQSRLAYTLVDASFGRAYANQTSGALVAAGNRLPGVPLQALAADISLRHHRNVESGLELRVESKTWANDLNSEAAPGFAVLNLRSSVEWKIGRTKLMLFGRIDNLFNRQYIGSVIVNDGAGRYYEPAAGRNFYLGLRAAL